jgi:hypothetical protein
VGILNSSAQGFPAANVKILWEIFSTSRALPRRSSVPRLTFAP